MAEAVRRGKPASEASGRLILVLGDQLTSTLSALAASDPARDRVLMVEAYQEGTYVPHHQENRLYPFGDAAFSRCFDRGGWSVDYITLDDPDNTGTLVGEVQRARLRHGVADVVATEPGEWRLKPISKRRRFDFGKMIVFLCDHAGFDAWAAGRKQLRMEYFYRDMRRDTGLLMEDGAPTGGKWNFDHDNRKPRAASSTCPRRRPFRRTPSR